MANQLYYPLDIFKARCIIKAKDLMHNKSKEIIKVDKQNYKDN